MGYNEELFIKYLDDYDPVLDLYKYKDVLVKINESREYEFYGSIIMYDGELAAVSRGPFLDCSEVLLHVYARLKLGHE